jgi:hypothetical protein
MAQQSPQSLRRTVAKLSPAPGFKREDASYLPQARESKAGEAGDIALVNMLDTCNAEVMKVIKAGTDLHVNTVDR